MSQESDSKHQADALARDILKLSRNMLHVRLRFLDLALGELHPEAVEDYSLGTDGKTLYYGSLHILKCYKDGQEKIARDLLHLMLHCILRHMFVGPVKIALWNLACDMAAEDALLEFKALPATEKDAVRQAALAFMASKVKNLTAEHIYRYLQETPMALEDFRKLSRLFEADNHWPWYLPKEPQTGENGKMLWNIKVTSLTEIEAIGIGLLDAVWKNRWQSLGYRMQVDLETYSNQWGNSAGNLLQNLDRLNREKYDYTEFLKKFAVLGEVMKINEDEFDQNFYTYGLNLYQNLPLIEPLEYKEVKRIREFVIAIDTSGSVAGSLVQKFVQKTYNILKSTESFFTKINLHIIQCDTTIQEDAKITSQEELEAYMKKMTLHGFGGTDFRPVFTYVDKLLFEKEFTNLKGLIYFTDGYGEFPSRKPAYQTAFVFVDQEQKPPMVPVWAIRLMLKTEDIEESS